MSSTSSHKQRLRRRRRGGIGFIQLASLLLFFVLPRTNGDDYEQQTQSVRLQGENSWTYEAVDVKPGGWVALSNGPEDENLRERPLSRQGHSMATYSPLDERFNARQEFLIITGGYRADDHTFTVWAFDITSKSHDAEGTTLARAEASDDNNATNPWILLSKGERDYDAPTARRDHVSAVVNHYLYVWGGALLNQTDDVDAIPYIWRADLSHLQWYPHDHQQREESEMTASLFKWERLVPNIRTEQGIQAHWNEVDRTERCKVSNRSRDSRDEEKLVSRFWNDTLTSINATSTSNSTKKAPKIISPQDALHLSRQGARGGVWTGFNESFHVMFGGSSNNKYPWDINRRSGDDVQLDDVWMLHFQTCTFQQLWGAQQENSPSKRVSHAATVAANGELVVYGGYTTERKSNDDDVETYRYITLGDYWILDLNHLLEGRQPRWEEREVPRDRSRWDHTLVDLNGEIVVFGGCASSFEEDVSRPYCEQRVATADTILINETGHSVSKVSSSGTDNFNEVPPRLFQHAASTDQHGRMYIWGDTDSVWKFDPSFVAPHVPDGGGSGSGVYFGKNGAVQRYIVALCICTFSLLAVCAVYVRRRQPEPERMGTLPEAAFSHTRTSSRRTETSPSLRAFCLRNGIGLTITYTPPCSITLPFLGRGDEESCSICLVEFYPGDRLRSLPCGHEFHARCIGRWLEDNTSCPTCRRSLRPGVGNGNTTNANDSPNDTLEDGNEEGVTNANDQPNDAAEVGNEEGAQLIAS